MKKSEQMKILKDNETKIIKCIYCGRKGEGVYYLCDMKEGKFNCDYCKKSWRTSPKIIEYNLRKLPYHKWGD